MTRHIGFITLIIDTTTFNISYNSLKNTIFEKMLKDTEYSKNISRIYIQNRTSTFLIDADLESFKYIISIMRGYKIRIDDMTDLQKYNFYIDYSYFFIDIHSRDDFFNKEKLNQSQNLISPNKSHIFTTIGGSSVLSDSEHLSALSALKLSELDNFTDTVDTEQFLNMHKLSNVNKSNILSDESDDYLSDTCGDNIIFEMNNKNNNTDVINLDTLTNIYESDLEKESDKQFDIELDNYISKKQNEPTNDMTTVLKNIQHNSAFITPEIMADISNDSFLLKFIKSQQDTNFDKDSSTISDSPVKTKMTSRIIKID